MLLLTADSIENTLRSLVKISCSLIEKSCFKIDISSEPTLEHSGVNYMPRDAGIEPATWLSGI